VTERHARGVLDTSTVILLSRIADIDGPEVVAVDTPPPRP